MIRYAGLSLLLVGLALWGPPRDPSASAVLLYNRKHCSREPGPTQRLGEGGGVPERLGAS